MTAYYNEVDKYCAAWLQNLMDAGHIAPGVIDTRSIEDVRPDEIAGFTQCHFFAGIGVWSLALRSAGWPDSRTVWTGSCPCQPFSVAGKGNGTSDSRHLWPHFFRLIKARRPGVVFGEQVASADVLGRTTGTKDYLSHLQRREELRGIPHGWAAPEIQGYLQGLSERAGTEKTFAEVLLNCRPAQEVEIEQSRQCVGFVGALSSQSAVTGFRSGCEGDSSSDRLGILRANGDAFRSEGQTQFAFAGSERPEQGVHDGQHTSRVDVREYHAEYMGSREDSSDRGRTQEQSLNDQRGTTDQADSGDDASNAQHWIDLVLNDLETANYAGAAIAFPSAGVGAPHIRDRTFWVAHASSEGLSEQHERWIKPARLTAPDGAAGGMADSNGRNASAERQQRGGEQRQQPQDGGVLRLADATISGRREERADGGRIGAGDRPQGIAAGLEHGGECRRVADAANKRLDGRRSSEAGNGRNEARIESERFCDAGGLADADSIPGGQGRAINSGRHHGGDAQSRAGLGGGELSRGMGGMRLPKSGPGIRAGVGEQRVPNSQQQSETTARRISTTGPTNGFWRNADWLGCTDGKWRPTQSTHECMADGLADSLGYVRTGDAWSLNPLIQGAKNRVGRLRGYGNAICAPAATAFIQSYMETAGIVQIEDRAA